MAISLQSCIKALLPASSGKVIHVLRRGIYCTSIYRKYVMRNKVARLRMKERIRVLFISYTPTMWKVDSLFRAMSKHERFDPQILIVPNMKLESHDARLSEYEGLKDFFDKKGYPYLEWCSIDGTTSCKKIPDEYDVLFYPQSGNGCVPYALDIFRHAGRLMVCSDYAFHSGRQNWAFNKWYQNASWIDCYENETMQQLSKREKFNKGVNSYVTGLPIVDEFNRSDYVDNWKPQLTTCKRIIWAPHWTLVQERSALPCYSNFLEMAEYMLEFAQSHIGKIQFAFKPHPWLKQELYRHSDWGKERTDAYYASWENGVNTQLEQQGYVDLFMTSDALIHDCSSFCCEYLLTGKPVLFMARNEDSQIAQLNEMSHAAFYSQYIGRAMEDLVHFLQEQVEAECDPMKEHRAATVAKYLTPPHGKSAAENILDAILTAPL